MTEKKSRIQKRKFSKEIMNLIWDAIVFWNQELTRRDLLRKPTISKEKHDISEAAEMKQTESTYTIKQIFIH